MSEAYDGFARSLIVPVLEKCGWAPRDEDAHLTRKLRGEVIAALPTFCAADDGVYAEAKRRFDAFRAGDDAALPSEYQSAVYKLVLARGGRETYVVDKDGTVMMVFNGQLNPEKHVEAASAAVADLPKGGGGFDLASLLPF